MPRIPARPVGEIPAGVISPRRALTFVAVNALLFVACAATINRLTALLSPVALAVIMGYSYCKRFTWAAHLVLGLSLSIAPVGAYIALTGRFDWEPCVLALLVLTWCGGFDIIYALQDADYDRAHGLHSIPQRFFAAHGARDQRGAPCGQRGRASVVRQLLSAGGRCCGRARRCSWPFSRRNICW